MRIKVKTLKQLIKESYLSNNNQNILTLNDKIEEMLQNFSVLAIETAIEDDKNMHPVINTGSNVAQPKNTNLSQPVVNQDIENSDGFELQKQMAVDDLFEKLKPIMADKITMITKDVFDRLKNKQYSVQSQTAGVHQYGPIP